MLYMFQAVPPPIIRSSKTVEEMRRDGTPWSSIPSTTVAGSSKTFDKVPDPVCTVFELLMMGGGTA